MRWILFLLILFPTLAIASQYPDCNIKTSSSANFSNDDKKDIITVTINGSPCYEGELSLSITNPDGKIIYNYTARFKLHTAVPWEDYKLDEVAKEVAAAMTKEAHFQSSKELPVWQPNDEYYEVNYQEIEVPKEYYNKLRQANWITFSHLTHYEGWRVIVYDRIEHKVVIVSNGGL